MQQTSLTPNEIARFREDTPGVEHYLHFNNAGAALPPRQVTDTVLSYLKEEAIAGGYRLETNYTEKLEELYISGAKLLNAEPEEIAFVQSATMAWRLAFNGLSFRTMDTILTGESEYGSNLLGLLQACKQYGLKLQVVPNDENGQISLDVLEQLMNDRVRLIALTHIATNSGVVQPVERVGEIARKAGCLYLLDACQSAGQMPLDVKAIGCDFLALTGRKYLRGPRGTGLLYVKKGLADRMRPVFLDITGARFKAWNSFELRDDARRFENYESNRALQLGLNEAIKYALDIGLDRIWQRVQHLGELLRSELSKIPTVKVLDGGASRCGIVTFMVEGTTAEAVKEKLLDQGVNLSTPSNGSGILLYKRLGLDTIIRASVHYYNTEEEIDRFVKLIRINGYASSVKS